MNTNFTLIFTLFIFLGCSSPDNKNKDVRSESNEPFQKTIKLNNTKDFNPAFKVENIIALEASKESYFGEINKLIIKDNIIYILDAFYLKKVLAFDLEGNFLRTYGEIGEAPGEYQKLTDFDVDKNGDVLILNRQHQKIHIYDRLGNFKETKKTEFRARSFKLLDDGYLFSLVLHTLDNTPYTQLIKTDLEFNILQSFFKFSSDLKDIKGNFNILNKNRDKILYHKPINDSIFIFNSKGDLIENINIDFGNKSVPQELKNDFAELWERVANNDYIFFTTPPLLFKNLLLGHIYQSENKGVLYIDIENHRTYKKHFNQKDLSPSLKFPIYNWNDSLLVSIVDLNIVENNSDKEVFSKEFQDYIIEHNSLGLIFSSYKDI